MKPDQLRDGVLAEDGKFFSTHSILSNDTRGTMMQHIIDQWLNHPDRKIKTELSLADWQMLRTELDEWMMNNWGAIRRFDVECIENHPVIIYLGEHFTIEGEDAP